MTETAAQPQHRLFFALWPPENLREQIERATCAPALQSGGRMIPARNFHVTVVFVGEVPQSSLQAVIAAGAAMPFAAFTLRLDRIDSWPRSHVLALTGPTPSELETLVAHLRFSLLGRQLLPQLPLTHEVYRPHLTLARRLPRRPELASNGLLERPIEWRVNEFVLVDSMVAPGGSEYRILQRWPLA